MAKLRQVSIKFNFKQAPSKCDICGKDDVSIAEVGEITKLSICDACADQLTSIHNNMKLMRTAS